MGQERDSDLTQDGIFSRALTIWQPRRGYRFGIDSVLLGIFARESAASCRVLDLGAGAGVVGLVLAFRTPDVPPPQEIVAVELQERLAQLAARNIETNGLPVPIRVLRTDLKQLSRKELREPFDLVVSNPPYYPAEEGERGPVNEKTIARQEIAATIQDVLDAAGRLVCPGGRLALVYPAPRLPRLFAALSRASFQPMALRPVYARAGEEATLVLLLARQKTGRRPPPMDFLPPYILADAQGKANPEIELLLRRGF